MHIRDVSVFTFSVQSLHRMEFLSKSESSVTKPAAGGDNEAAESVASLGPHLFNGAV